MNKQYAASLDRRSKGLTVIFFGIAAFVFIATLNTDVKYQSLGGNVTGALGLIAFIITYFIHPTGYSLQDNEFCVHRPIGKIRFRYDTIEYVERITDSDLAGSWRVFGSGGLFGYFGKFRNNPLGNYTLYGANNNNYVLVSFKNTHKKIVLTPDDPFFYDDFQSVLRSQSNFT
jgi:hypothetical protein